MYDAILFFRGQNRLAMLSTSGEKWEICSLPEFSTYCFGYLWGKYIRLRLDDLKLVPSQSLWFHSSTFSCCWMFYHSNYLKIWNYYLFHHTTVIYLTIINGFEGNMAVYRLPSPKTAYCLKIHVLFVILYRIYRLKKVIV